jgi:hypothetical protein
MFHNCPQIKRGTTLVALTWPRIPVLGHPIREYRWWAIEGAKGVLARSKRSLRDLKERVPSVYIS